MRAMLCILALVPTILAQDDVQVDCTPDHMEIRVTKVVVETMGFASTDVHLEDQECKFDEEETGDGQFYVYRMSPLTACGTEVKLNGTHVEYKNKLIAGNDASVLEKGAVIVGTADSTSRQTLAAKLKCLFPVELMVSTAFLPNISHVTIPLPPAYGIGKFMATMHLYKTDQYLETYQSNPQLNTGDYLNVGEYFNFSKFENFGIFWKLLLRVLNDFSWKTVPDFESDRISVQPVILNLILFD
jgi:hypothetical protein